MNTGTVDSGIFATFSRRLATGDTDTGNNGQPVDLDIGIGVSC